MVRIRLSRKGRKKQPFYHIVVADARAPRDGKFIERIGYYNPMIQDGLVLDDERLNYWVKVGAQPTEIVLKIIQRKLSQAQA